MASTLDDDNRQPANDRDDPPVFSQLQRIVDDLARDLHAHVAFLVDRDGMLLAAAGDGDALANVSFAGLTEGSSLDELVARLFAHEDATLPIVEDRARLMVRLCGRRAFLATIVADEHASRVVRDSLRASAETVATLLDETIRELHAHGHVDLAHEPFAEFTADDLADLLGE